MSDSRRRARLLRAAIGRSGPVEPTTADWSAWVELARAERVLPQLWRVAAGAEGLTAEQHAEAEEIELDVAAAMVRLEHDLLHVGTVLDRAGVVFVVLKGAATAHLDHRDPADRQLGDLDLLVDPDALAVARAALEAVGWQQGYRLPRHHEAFTHAITFVGSGATELDVHQRIAHRALGRLVPTAELLGRRAPFEIAGRPFSALSGPDRLVHAALHSVTSRGEYRRLSSTVDVLVLAAGQEHRADEVVEAADRWSVRGIVERGLRDAHVAAELELPAAWSAALARRGPRPDALIDRAYLADKRRPVLEEVAHLRHIPSWQERARYLSGYFVIDRDHAEGGHEGIGARARYLWARVRQRSG